MTRAQKLSALAASALAVAALVLPSLALSQDTTTTTTTTSTDSEKKAEGEGSTELDSITVTGSILRRTDLETPSPVTVLSAETLEQRGINTVAEALQRLPMNNAGTIQQGWNTGSNFASGANAPSLRGLTVQSTLSIADGLRLSPYPLADDGHRNFVDLNTIPSSIVDRVEILRDGASSTYGADAIAGVINVITKKEIKGFHFGVAQGVSQHGGGDEKRLDMAWGLGDLTSQGYNFYIGGEYQGQDELWRRDRDYPFNTLDWSGMCGPSGSCMSNLNWNGVTFESGHFNGLISTPGVSLVRPVNVGATSGGTAQYEYLNQNGGDPCREWPSYNRTDPAYAGVDFTADGTNIIAPTTICDVNFNGAYLQLQPEIERIGMATRFTANVLDGSQLYVMANYYKTDTVTQTTPNGFNGTPVVPRPAGLPAYNVILPIYTCPQGVGTRNGEGTGCDSTNGVLNPYNPYAAGGQKAQILLRSPFARGIETNASSARAAVGLDGSFGDGWGYATSLTASNFSLDVIQRNWLIPQRIMNVVATGAFNFSDPYANPQAVWDYIGPLNVTHSTSNLWQAQGSISKEIVQLPGGPLLGAFGLSYRKESLDNPSANPADEFSNIGPAAYASSAYSRYYSVNAVGAAGSRDVQSAFFEVAAPVIDSLELMASGRFDDYSSGQSNFSPKVGFKFKPVDQAALRGTWSEGFRIPSFNEAYGLPTTGYVNQAGINCAAPPAGYASYCAAHGNNSYATSPYSVGLTSVGNPALDPEESTSFTLGVVLEPVDRLSFTIDYWNIEIDGLIKSVSADATLIASYYANNGNPPDVPDGVTLVPGQVDPAFPNALPQLGFIVSSFDNIDSQEASGLDFGVNWTLPVGGGLTYRTVLDASWMMEFNQILSDGTKLEYAGTLSPCDVTSCSGAPEWRGVWQNTLELGGTPYGTTALSFTTYYTDGYSTASNDYLAGAPDDCANSLGNSTATYEDGTPVNCTQDAQWNIDMTVRQTYLEKYSVYLDVLNVLDIGPDFDPSAAYGSAVGLGFNPAWGGPNIMGRFFRLGVKAEF
jgi:iron complex outermembrane receptor protein